MMKKYLLVICLLAALVYACNHGDRTIHRLLTTDKLRTQTFVIDIARDTVLTTKKGALIRIPKGAIAADGNIVKLEVKEAYSMRDILKAGLTTTQSNGQPLSSGGMIYINAISDNNVRITQKIFVATPTPYIDKNMQLFKGEVQGDSTITWMPPQPMPENPQLTALDKGKVLFQDHCASCHSIDKDLTGPALGGVMERTLPMLGDKATLYAFTRNPPKVMKDNIYLQCLKKKFGGAMMTAFTSLTDEELDNIYGYIENESRRLKQVSDKKYKSCLDSCQLYNEVAGQWKQIKASLENPNSPLRQNLNNFEEDTTPDFAYDEDEIMLTDNDEPTPADLEMVNPADNKSFYFQFTIESFGWYNVDILLNDSTGAAPSELRVRIQGQYKELFDIYLVIPSIKLFVPGGLLKGKKDVYGFYQADGSIPLPQQKQAYIIAMGEDKDKVIFAKKEFITQQKQSFDLTLTAITQEAFQRELATLQLNEDNAYSKATALIRSIKDLKSAEQLKPKNCNCDCFTTPVAPNSENVYEMGNISDQDESSTVDSTIRVPNK